MRSTADIAAIEYRDSFQALDNLTFSHLSVRKVPEPASLLLMFFGVFFFVHWRFKSKDNLQS